MTTANTLLLCRTAALMTTALAAAFAAGCAAPPQPLRVATFNVRDLDRRQLSDRSDQRVDNLCRAIVALRADVLLINEISYISDEPSGGNAARLAQRIDRAARVLGVPPLGYHVFARPVNTGIPSGHDLDNDGVIDSTPGDRTYAVDCLGFGVYPGQYAMALLVRDGIDILADDARTFARFLWSDMPGALLPPMPGQPGVGWYDQAELAILPLSSKSHWDVPLRLENGAVIHLLCSHPTPPVFDGPEDRNGRRNHDEIRFWGEYLSGATWIVDDDGNSGGLDPTAQCIILGDLNADPIDGDSRGAPTAQWLLSNPRIAATPTPRATVAVPNLDDTDTSHFRLRVDYVLPSTALHPQASGIMRSAPGVEPWPSDHFPVWVDLLVPSAEE